MEDAKQIPKEESIATLIKKKVVEEINKVKVQLNDKYSRISKETNTSNKDRYQSHNYQQGNKRPYDNGQH
jgi:hypothetical protein